MLTGSCGCGRVRYQITGALIGPITQCHCWRCRKQSGASFGTTAGVARGDFAVVAGADLLRAWQSSPGVERFFASCCGSPIFKRDAADPEEFGFRLGTLDTDPGVTVEMHFRAGSKVPWVEICDDLPREESGPPFGAQD